MTEWIITSSVLIVIIAVLRFLLRGKISLKLQYALWGLVLIRLLLPFSVFESSASVLNLIPEREETYTPPIYYEPYAPGTISPAVPDEDIFILDNNIENIGPDVNIIVDENGYVTEPEITVIDWGDILLAVWGVGIAVFGTVFAVSNLRFSKKLKKTREYVSDKKAWLPVYVTPAVKTPCLFGVFKPSIYITKEVYADEKVLRHVLEHETTHYRHGDHVWSVLRCLCLAVHWYNPLVWLAAFLSMRDSELACDEATIGRIGESERIEYGRTLIDLTCEKPAVGIISAATTMTGSKSSIKERIMLIAKKPKMLWITAVLVAVIAIFAIGCTFTGAVKYNPKTTDEPAAETFSNRIEPELSGLDGTIKMVVTAASPKKITTEIFNDTSEDIYYRISYSLYFEQDGKWYVLPKINDNNEFDFGTKIVESGKTGLWTSDIKEIYGKLPDGKYCINRTINYGDMDFVENEFYVIGAEFVLKDGKLIHEAPSELEKGDYEIKKQIFLHSASSNLEIPERRYEIAENSFAIYDSVNDTEIETIPISEWKWEEFPYSEESWNEFFIIGLDFPDISKYQSKYYQPIDEESFIAYLDGELWLVEITPVKPTSEEYMVWSIYELAAEKKVESEKIYWENIPAMSSKTPWFEFSFDFDFDHINAGVYATSGEGALYDIKNSKIVNTMLLENGDMLRWVPYENGTYNVPSATVNFVVYQNDDLEKFTHTGSLKIKQIGSESGKTLYEATLVSETLSLSQNIEFGGGIIYLKPTNEEGEVHEEYTEEEYETAIKELGYTEEQLAYIEGLFEEGLSPLAVMEPLKYSKAFGETLWPEGMEYSVRSFYFDPDIYADYGGPIGFVSIHRNGEVKIVPEFPNYYSSWDVVDSETFYFGDADGVRIYNINDISEPVVSWNVPEEKLLNKEWKPILTFASSEKNGEIIVFWINRPANFDNIYNGGKPDEANYMVTVLDKNGTVKGEYDTGIKMVLTEYGNPNCVSPEVKAVSESSVLFKINNLHYVFDYGASRPIAKQYIFTESDVVQYSNIDFGGDFAKSAVRAVTDYITKNYSESDESKSFEILQVEIDENATSAEINLTGGSVKGLYDSEDILNGFLIIRTKISEFFTDGSSFLIERKYSVLYDPENKYENGRMLGSSGWKLIGANKEMFDGPEFDDNRFYTYFEEGRIG